MERKRPVFAWRPMQFPPRNPSSCTKTRTHCRHTSRASPFTRQKCVTEEKHQRQRNRGSILRQACRYELKGTITRTPCEYWHPPECFLKEKTTTGCKSGDTCLFPQFKVDEQPKKKPKKGYFPTRRENEDKGAVAIVKGVSQLGCVLD